MDNETKLILQKSVNDWCANNTHLIKQLETPKQNQETSHILFNELSQLGLLNIFFEEETRNDIGMLAEVAYQFSLHSASIALMVIQQNLACSLLANAAQDAPDGWVALPIYDSIHEWPYQLRMQKKDNPRTLSGIWRSISLLPIANRLLLPVCQNHDNTLSLANINIQTINTQGTTRNRIHLHPAFASLGLRGAPSSDLELDNYELTDNDLILTNCEDKTLISNLWSQAELFVMAIRSGIAESSYKTALDYASDRWQGGKIIIEHSLIRKMLADMYREKCALEESWRNFSGINSSTQPLTDGQMSTALTSAEKLPWLTSDGIQLLGGIGYMSDFPQERRFRDAKQCEFLLGHPQVKSFSTWQSHAC